MPSVNTNFGAQIALQSLNRTNAELGQVQERISTGLKVGSAKDDGAAYAIAQSLRAQNSALDSVTDSLNRGRSTVDLAVAAGESISSLLSDAKKLVVNASDLSLDTASRQAYQDQYQAKFTQIRTQVANASLNGVNLLDGSTTEISALANTSGTSTITVAGQNLATATGFSGGTAAVKSIQVTSAGPAATASDNDATDVTTISQDSTLNVTANGTSFSVAFAAGGYKTADISTKINAAFTAAGGVGTLTTAALGVLTTQGATVGSTTYSPGTGDLSSSASVLALTGATAGAAITTDAAGAATNAAISGVTGLGVSQSSAFTLQTDTGTRFTVTLAQGYYDATKLSSAINSAYTSSGGSGTVANVSNGTLKLTGITNNGVGVAASGAGDFGTTNEIRTALAGSTSGFTQTTAYSAAVAYTQTGGGGLVNVSGTESFSTTTNYTDLLSKIDSSIGNVTSSLGKLGVGQTTLDGHKTFVSKLQDTLTTSIGNLVDADLAKESARLQALQTKQQLGAQALSIANQAPQVLLSLFR